ncbi:hypothetical protein F2P56_001774 [Juglans regia]|uniref:RNase H type-1 domain-containing protein n=1 Tax=Juglans regia TaxID=51240 RepID=A0A834D4E3_JUGRE|nr:hypothetical protein F2P56_001774 [Juglans regia]
MEEVAVVMRGLWLRRNTFVFESKLLSNTYVISVARESLEEYQSSILKITEIRQQANTGDVVHSWSPPSVNWFKANWDAALDVKQRKVGLGVVIKNDRGEVMAACCESKNFVEQPAIAEGWALRKAMELCEDLKFNKVILEGDAQVVVNAVNSQTEDLSYFGSIIEDLKVQMKEWPNWSVKFANRNINTVAHTFAKEALHIDLEKIWIEDIPVCLSDCLLRDYCIVNTDI